ncbi:hypothetical protein FE275_11800 [Pseudomonas koreensis]|nr:hypothetical protein FE275_11800 [Pseudomonas koreensis]
MGAGLTTATQLTDTKEIQLWERACSRMAPVSQHTYRLTHRFREQARSHSCRITKARRTFTAPSIEPAEQHRQT